MKNGELRECSLWFNGEEQMRKAEKIICNTFWNEQEELSIQYGDIQFQVVDQPNPPEPGARVLLGQAYVIDDARPKQIDVAAFMKTLSPSDRKRLRNLTIRQFKMNYPGVPVPPMNTIDQVIADEGLKHILNTAEWAKSLGKVEH